MDAGRGGECVLASSCCVTISPNCTFFFKVVFFLFFFDVDHFKNLIEFVTISLLFYVLVFLAMRHVGSNPYPPHWKAKS